MDAALRSLALLIGSLLVGIVAVPLIGLGPDGLVLAGRGVPLLAVHGGVLLGVGIYWWHQTRKGRKLDAIGVFYAGFLAETMLCIATFSVMGFYDAFGNIGGVLIILWPVAGTVTSVGVALLFFAIYGRRAGFAVKW
jgi:hypothetical protein